MYVLCDNAITRNGQKVTEWKESPGKSEKEMVERQDKEGAAMGEWGIFSHPAEKGRHTWTGGGGRSVMALDCAEIYLKPKTTTKVDIKAML